jgi:RNA polymerase sigma-70 factor (ECF subfamily)
MSLEKSAEDWIGTPMLAAASSSASAYPLNLLEERAQWFAKEVHPHEPELRRWLHGQFPTLTDIDDIVQETYLRLMRAGASDAVRDPRSYLFTSARNVVIDRFRRTGKLRTEPLIDSAESGVLEDGPRAPEILNRAQEIEMLEQAMKTLPARCREVMTLKKVEGLANGEIAERLGISINTVNAQIVTGLMRCRNYLRAHGVLRANERR